MPFDLFGEVRITVPEVRAWVLAVAGIPADSPRFEHYVLHWNVLEKIRAAKVAGTFAAIAAEGERLSTAQEPGPLPSRLRWTLPHRLARVR